MGKAGWSSQEEVSIDSPEVFLLLLRSPKDEMCQTGNGDSHDRFQSWDINVLGSEARTKAPNGKVDSATWANPGFQMSRLGAHLFLTVIGGARRVIWTSAPKYPPNRQPTGTFRTPGIFAFYSL